MSGHVPTVTIAVDAMGGDQAPDINVRGSVLALESCENLKVMLVGDQSVLSSRLKRLGTHESDRLRIVHASETITMKDVVSQAVRKKRDSSIHAGIGLVKDQQAGAFISAGNSGAVMGCALMLLGRLPDVERPAIILKIPTAEGYAILLDGGANVDCKVSQFIQFARMGQVYASAIEGIAHPRVGLLSNASEAHKGNEVTREVHAQLLNDDQVHYAGYVEGYDLFRGSADVIVCDGFVGNIVLKSVEGVADMLFQWFRQEIRKDVFGMLGVFLMRRLVKKFKGKFDYEPYGAAPLLGINGMVMIAHGGSTEIAIKNGILTAKRGVEQRFLQKVTEQLEGRRL